MDKLNLRDDFLSALITLYARTEQREDMQEDSEALGAFDHFLFWLIREINPKTVGDFAKFGNCDVCYYGLNFIIERDASGAYDQIDGFLEFAVLDLNDLDGIPKEYWGMDGLQLCERIEAIEADEAQLAGRVARCSERSKH
ncbi:MAG TPA: hypothetical protein VN736_00475 [Candidatus Limnocylindrales bacterium]|nr:hypothetical protein [Candidatus Limnocylindrales bacterium]